MCIDHRWMWAYDYTRADGILKATQTREDAQAYFSYFDRKTEKVHQWSPSDGDFDSWVQALGEDAVECWETHAQSSANHVVYNNGEWSDGFSFNPRGQYLTWPGRKGTAWIEGQATEAWEVPRGAVGVVQIPETGIDGTGAYSCFYHATF